MTVLVSAVRQMIAEGPASAPSPAPRPATRRRRWPPTAPPPASRRSCSCRAGKVSVAQLLQPLANGALVLSLDTDFDGCMRIVQRLADEGLVYLANSMNSLRLEGQKTVAIEIVQQWDWQVPDVVVIPGGNLGNVSALGAGFDMMRALGRGHQGAADRRRAGGARQPAVPGLQERLGVRAGAAQSTLASAIQIGNPVSIRKAIRTLQRYDGIVEQATEAELADASAAADRTGMFNCPHTGVALAVLEKLAARGEITRDRARGRDLDGQRPEVQRLQAAVPHAPARRRRRAHVQPAGRAAQRLRRRAPRHRAAGARLESPSRGGREEDPEARAVGLGGLLLLPILLFGYLFATREPPDGPRVDAGNGVVGVETGGAYA